jgi:hypothetical protein
MKHRLAGTSPSVEHQAKITLCVLTGKLCGNGHNFG